MDTNLITAEDHTLFLNCLQNILTSGREYTVLLTNKNGKYVAQYLENSSNDAIEFMNHKINPKTAESSITENQDEVNSEANTILGTNQFQKNSDDDIFIRFNKDKSEIKEGVGKSISLTPREIEVITLVAKEYTTREIANELCLSKHTIESYRKKLISKLNVRNLAGLTKHALKMRYINLDTAF